MIEMMLNRVWNLTEPNAARFDAGRDSASRI
jgi:hypothetical protein